MYLCHEYLELGLAYKNLLIKFPLIPVCHECALSIFTGAALRPSDNAMKTAPDVLEIEVY
jgi:hypothetical protein